MLKKALGLLLLSSFLAGCSAPRIHATKFTSYDDFSAGPEGGVDLVWARIGLRDEERFKAKMKDYDSVIIDRVIVVVSEEDQPLDDEDINELVDHMQVQLEEKIAPFKTIVEEPSESTLRMSIAISNVETPNPILAVTSSILPFGIGMSTISKITTGEHTNVGAASIEILVSESVSEKPLFAAIDRESGNKDFGTMIDSLDDAKDAIDWWVERLGVTLRDVDGEE